MKLITSLIDSLDITKHPLILRIEIKHLLPPHGECLCIKDAIWLEQCPSFNHIPTIDKYNLQGVFVLMAWNLFGRFVCILSMVRTSEIPKNGLWHMKLYRISLNPLKHQLWVKNGVILGHVVSKNGILMDYRKIVQRFTRHTRYYMRFIYIYVDIAHPLYKLLIEFVWMEECQRAYDPLKKEVATTPILRAPN